MYIYTALYAKNARGLELVFSASVLPVTQANHKRYTYRFSTPFQLNLTQIRYTHMNRSSWGLMHLQSDFLLNDAFYKPMPTFFTDCHAHTSFPIMLPARHSVCTASFSGSQTMLYVCNRLGGGLYSFASAFQLTYCIRLSCIALHAL